MQFVETSHDISLLGKIAASTRVWAMPLGEPMQDLTVVLHSLGALTPAGNINWSVYFGGKFSGDPYESTSTHSGGIVQQFGVIAGPVEVAEAIYSGRVIVPTNLRQVNYSNVGAVSRKGYSGFPIVLEVVNNTLETIHLTATFIYRNSAIT